MDKDKEKVWKKLTTVHREPINISFSNDGTTMTGPTGLRYSLSTAWDIKTATLEIK